MYKTQIDLRSVFLFIYILFYFINEQLLHIMNYLHLSLIISLSCSLAMAKTTIQQKTQTNDFIIYSNLIQTTNTLLLSFNLENLFSILYVFFYFTNNTKQKNDGNKNRFVSDNQKQNFFRS